MGCVALNRLRASATIQQRMLSLRLVCVLYYSSLSFSKPAVNPGVNCSELGLVSETRRGWMGSLKRAEV